MEPQVEIYCKKDRKKDCSCLWLIVAIISTVLSFFIGGLVGTLLSLTTLVGYIVVLIITLAILLLISIISLICCKKNDKKKNCCC